MTEHSDTLPYKLFNETLNRLINELGLTEQTDGDGGPHIALESQIPAASGSVGNVRLFTGQPLFRVVTCSLVVPVMELDSHMMFAFTPGTSGVPHFTLDSVKAGDHFAFHLDLIPRLDLGANLEYMREAFSPLTEAFEQGCAIEGLSKAHLSPMQTAIMSPWMLAHRATESAFEQIEASVRCYQDHWFGLLQQGISKTALGQVSKEQLVERNKLNKAMIFSPDIDPVWHRITALIGEDAVAQQRALLIGNDE